MESDISASKSPEEILRILREACRTCGQVVQIRLYCNNAASVEAICFIDMAGDLNMAASHIKGTRFGNSSLYKCLPLSPDFRCAQRPQGELLSSACSRCRTMGD